MEIKEYYDNFLIEEYRTLVNAHFQTSQKITSFFQYALLIFSAPLILVSSSSSVEKLNISEFTQGIIYIFIGVVGLYVSIYLTQLRVESLLYARYINRIRMILYSQIDQDDFDRYGLDRQTILLFNDSKPKYIDKGQFANVNIVLGLFCSLYLSYGAVKLINHIVSFQVDILCKFVIALTLFVLTSIMQIINIKRIHRRNEKGEDYFVNTIGIDIDGVIADHRIQFARTIKMVYKRDIDPDMITTIPAWECGIVSREEHDAVFKYKDYWLDMGEMESACKYINLLYQRFNIEIYTSRDGTIDKCYGKYEDFPSNIESITKYWLKELSVRYHKIYFDRINQKDDRYKMSNEKGIKFFVEDNLENAIKLSKFCKYVFLIDHPYNRNLGQKNTSIPFNIKRVSSWKEIYELISQTE